MPALNFQRDFKAPIQMGQKILTLRAPRKDGRDPAKIGSSLKLFTGMRSKSVELILEAQVVYRTAIQFGRGGPVCMSWRGAESHGGPGQVADHLAIWMRLDLGGERDAMSDQFARWDGFKDWSELWSFHGPDAGRAGLVCRELIAWQPPATPVRGPK